MSVRHKSPRASGDASSGRPCYPNVRAKLRVDKPVCDGSHRRCTPKETCGNTKQPCGNSSHRWPGPCRRNERQKATTARLLTCEMISAPKRLEGRFSNPMILAERHWCQDRVQPCNATHHVKAYASSWAATIGAQQVSAETEASTYVM